MCFRDLATDGDDLGRETVDEVSDEDSEVFAGFFPESDGSLVSVVGKFVENLRSKNDIFGDERHRSAQESGCSQIGFGAAFRAAGTEVAVFDDYDVAEFDPPPVSADQHRRTHEAASNARGREHDSCSDACSDGDQNKPVRFSFSGSEIVFTEGGDVGVVSHDDGGVDGFADGRGEVDISIASEFAVDGFAEIRRPADEVAIDVSWDGHADGSESVGGFCSLYSLRDGVYGFRRALFGVRRSFDPGTDRVAGFVEGCGAEVGASQIYADDDGIRHTRHFIGNNGEMPLPSGPLKRAALDVGFDIAGICPAVEPPHFHEYLEWLSRGMHAGMGWMARSRELRSSPVKLMEGCKSILAVGLNYAQDSSLMGDDMKVSKYAWGRDYHKVVRSKLRRVVRWLGVEHPDVRSRICVDSAPILERDYAWLAGLGWFGKNSCLINTERGSWFFIGLLLMDAEFEVDEPASGGCGTCRACIDACPTGALVLRESSPVAFVDSNRCISYLTIEHRGEFSEEQAKMLNGWVFGCDICQDVCPFNRPRRHHLLRAKRTEEPDFKPRTQNVIPDREVLSRGDEIEFRRLYSGSALMRAGAKRMRRNVRAL